MSDHDRVTYTLVVHEEDGSLWAEVQELPGCFISGDNLDELKEAAQEAIETYLTDSQPSADVVPITSKRRHYAPRTLELQAL